MLRKQTIRVYGTFAPYTSKTFATFTIEREHAFNGFDDDAWHIAKSHCLICPACGFKWAVLQFADETVQWPVAQTCEACSLADDWMPVPGSLLNEEGYGIIDYHLLRALPPVLLEREFELHLTAYEAKTLCELLQPSTSPVVIGAGG